MEKLPEIKFLDRLKLKDLHVFLGVTGPIKLTLKENYIKIQYSTEVIQHDGTKLDMRYLSDFESLVFEYPGNFPYLESEELRSFLSVKFGYEYAVKLKPYIEKNYEGKDVQNALYNVDRNIDEYKKIIQNSQVIIDRVMERNADVEGYNDSLNQTIGEILRNEKLESVPA